MGGPTDYTHAEVLAKRATRSIERGKTVTIHSQRGDRVMGQPITLLAPFDPNFDEFASTVAHLLRHKVVYRTDGGKFARGLVRVSGQLLDIHTDYLQLGTPPSKGTAIRLVAHLARLKEAIPPNRWTMSILFQAPDFTSFAPTQIVKDPPAAACQNSMTKMLDIAVLAFDNPPAPINLTVQKRIGKMLEIAERLGCPGNEELWYYDRDAAVEYVKWETADSRRATMTNPTTGKLPFDGNSAYWGRPWRQFPFRRIARECSVLDPTNCERNVLKEFSRVNNEIVNTLDDVNRENDRISSMTGSWFAGNTKNPLVDKFLRHLYDLQNSPDHLYSAFR